MIWFTSDTHFYHQNVIKYCTRPFETVEEMNEIMVKNWNETVAPDDTVYFLGDFSLAFRPVELFTKRLNGYKILVAGNHDWCHPANKKSRTPEKAQAVRKMYYDNGWNEIHLNLTIQVGERTVNLCHLPYLGDYTDERYTKFRIPNDGNWLFCGHVHEKWTIKGNMINVGVDRWDFKPVSIKTLQELMNSAEGSQKQGS